MKPAQHFSLALMVATVLGCAACGSADNPTSQGQPGTSTAVAQSTPPVSATATATEMRAPTGYQFSQAPGPQAPEPEASQPGASWSPGAEADVVATASKAMAAFGSPEVGEPEWFENLNPYLTADAAESMSYTDPQNIPVHAVKGAGKLLKDTANPFGAVVEFSTDAGTYSVQVVRIGDAAPWQVATIAPAGNK